MLNFNNPIKMCTRNSCCPTIEFDESGPNTNAIIKDDFNGEVILSVDELEMMGKIFREYLNQNPNLNVKSPEIK